MPTTDTPSASPQPFYRPISHQKRESSRLARDRRRAGSSVRLAVVVRRTSRAVDASEDSRLISGVSAGERGSLGGAEGAAAGEVDLGAGLVELGLAGLAGGVQGEDLDAEQVLAVGDAGGDVEVDPAVVGEEVVDAPDAAVGVEGVFPDLEPVVVYCVSERDSGKDWNGDDDNRE